MPNYRVQNGQLTKEKGDMFEIASGDLSVKATGTNEPGSWSAYIKLKARSSMERLVGYTGDVQCSILADDGSRWVGKAALGKIFPDSHELELKGTGPLSAMQAAGQSRIGS